MKIEQTKFADLFIIHPRIFHDERGYFFESFNKEIFEENTGLSIDFVQDNEASSTFGVLRGLHYQLHPFAQAKLVRVIQGKVLDVVVDIREKSKTYGKYFSIELSGENKKQLFVPHGFAHGYIVLSDTAIFAYKCDNLYSKEYEGGIKYNDINLSIDWHTDHLNHIVSSKDLDQPKFGEHKTYLH